TPGLEMRTGTPPTDFCSVTRAELFGPAPLAASAFSLCTTAGGFGTPGDCSMGGLAPANTLVPPRVIAREAVSRLFISARQWEEFRRRCGHTNHQERRNSIRVLRE